MLFERALCYIYNVASLCVLTGYGECMDTTTGSRPFINLPCFSIAQLLFSSGSDAVMFPLARMCFFLISCSH